MDNSDLLEGMFAYLALIPFVGWTASSRMKRSFGTWCLLSLLVTPLVAMVFLMILGPQKEEPPAGGQAPPSPPHP